LLQWSKSCEIGEGTQAHCTNTKQRLLSGTRSFLLQVRGTASWLIVEDVSDAFWLAHIYFHIQSYARAHALLTKHNYLEASFDCRYLAALCLVRIIRMCLIQIKLSKWEDALDLLDETVLHAAGAYSFNCPDSSEIVEEDE
jgi:hypothetical protein